MEQRGVFWSNEKKFFDLRGRTGMVESVGGNSKFKTFLFTFDGTGQTLYTAESEIYFQDHPDGYNQFNK